VVRYQLRHSPKLLEQVINCPRRRLIDVVAVRPTQLLPDERH
jgi:hypothetical protein